MRRDQRMAVRLSAEELALLPALRHAIAEDVSQAEVLVWALEDLCRRIVAGDQLGSVITTDGAAICSAALNHLNRARASEPRNAEPLGRPPYTTAAERRMISALQQESPKGVPTA